MAVGIKSAVSVMTAASLLTLAATGSVHAGVLDLNLHGANVFALTDFKAPSSDVEGSILAGRDVQLSSYSVNDKNFDAYGSYCSAAAILSRVRGDFVAVLGPTFATQLSL